MTRLAQQNLHLWQQEALPGYLKRYNNREKVEVTIAYQGSGKTLYTAACFVSSVLDTDNIAQKKIGEIREQFRCAILKQKNHFAIVFVPSLSIVRSTLRDWKELGVNLVKACNKDLENKEPESFLRNGINGVIVTYQQTYRTGEKFEGIWQDNELVKFIQKSRNLNFHAVLDECHTLTVTKQKTKDGEETFANLSARYLISNAPLFTKLHLITGTPAKKNTEYLIKRIPFVRYNSEGKVVPNTVYSQEQSVKDKTITNTNVLIHSFEEISVNLNGRDITIREDDLIFYSENAHILSSQNSWHKDYHRLWDIHNAFKCAYLGLPLWKQLLCYGEKWLNEIREVYKPAIGLIFAPSTEVAVKLHKELLFNSSVLCISKTKDVDSRGLKRIDAKFIGDYLESRDKKLRWVITCEALMQGFDFPDCKVNILLPRLEFLYPIKISQMLGRTNRRVPGFDNLEAMCITLNYKPVKDLIESDKSSRLTLCDPNDYYSDLIEIHNQAIVKEKIEELREHCGIERRSQKLDIFLKGLIISDTVDLLGSADSKIRYDSDIIKSIKESRIRTFWTNWTDIVFGNSDVPEEMMPPKNESGIYIIINCKTQEYLYVGESGNLRARIGDKKRFLNAEWVRTEGHQNIYVKWHICEDRLQAEKEAIIELKPKYNKLFLNQLRVAS